MSSSGVGASTDVEEDGRPKIISFNPIRIPHETKVVASKQSEISQPSASKSRQGNTPHHNHHSHHHHHHQQQQQHLLLLNRQECSSNQSGSDSGICYTNSISSENSSLIVNTTSLEQINAHSNSNNDNNSNNNQEITAIKFASNDRGREIPITQSDSFNTEAQSSNGSNNDSTISCIENGKIDAAATTTTTTNIPNKVANGSVGGNMHGMEAQHLRGNDKQLAKSVKVSESNNNNVNTNQRNSLSSPSLLIPRTKDELGGQEAFVDINESSSGNKARVINNTDDEAKIKHSTRRRANQSAISTSRPSKVTDGEPDRTADVSMGHEIRGANVRLPVADELSPVPTNPIVSPRSDAVPSLIKSSLKKTGDRSADSNKSKHNRNVSFNQTVIVFCEEIETSSPSETFEPPLDYQDASPVDEPHDPSGVSQRAVGNRFDKSSNVYANDDFEILSKIVGDDASILTDDQLFGLLEKGSLLKNFDLDEDEQALTIDRLNSNQSYLCHNAISESESESSLTIDTHLKDVPAVINKSVTPSSKLVEYKPHPPEKSQPAGNQSSSKSDHEKSSGHRVNSQPVDICPASIAEPNSFPQQRSMPARVKVSTVDNNLRRQQKTVIPTQDEVDSGNHTRNACPKVIQSQKQGTTIKPEPMLVRLTNVEQTILLKSQIEDDISDFDANRQLTRDEDHVCSLPTAVKSNLTPNSLIIYDNQMSSRDSRLAEQQHKQQHRDSSSSQQLAPQTPNQTSNVVNAQIIQTSQACHICRAIESNLHQSEFGSRGERASLLTNNGSTLHSTKTTTDQPQVQRAARPPHQFHGTGSAIIEHQKQSQLVSSQSSCVSCRESIVRQQQQQQKCVTQPARPDLAKNLLDHQQAKPIACQLVYVVDQCGNRMKALQVVGPAQAGVHNNQVRPIMIAAENCRLPAPSAGQNWIRVSNPSGQVLGVVRNASLQMNMNNTQAMNSGHAGQLPAGGAAPSAFTQQPRMHIVSQSAPRNHTVYYVRQPLGSQDFRQSSSSMTSSVARSFPDVHEIRRLDGIRAPTESPGLIQATNHANISPRQPENKSHMPGLYSEDRRQKLRRDDSEDPTFGFSRRPAVKVVANAMRESHTQAGGKSNSNLNQSTSSNDHQRLLSGSVTLDRKSFNRDQSPQREVKENIPSTSSMSNINKTLASYVGQPVNHGYENTAKPKGMKFKHWFSIKRQ